MTAIAEPTNLELLATAIPVGVAKQSFTDVNDALLAVLIFGMGVGVEDPERATRLVDVSEGIIRSDPRANAEFNAFLSGCTAIIRGLTR